MINVRMAQTRCSERPIGQQEPTSTLLPRYAGSMARMWRSGRHPVWISDAHEAEAREAQLRKPPSRFGTWFLQRLGFRGEIGDRTPHVQTRHPHEHPVHRPPGN